MKVVANLSALIVACVLLATAPYLAMFGLHHFRGDDYSTVISDLGGGVKVTLFLVIPSVCALTIAMAGLLFVVGVLRIVRGMKKVKKDKKKSKQKKAANAPQ